MNKSHTGTLISNQNKWTRVAFDYMDESQQSNIK